MIISLLNDAKIYSDPMQAQSVGVVEYADGISADGKNSPH